MATPCVVSADESSGCVSSTDEESDANEQVTVSILDRLKAPTPSDLHRKRKTKVNPPCGKKRSTSSSSSSDPKRVTPIERVRQYPKEPFKVSNNRLFCYGCREEIKLKTTIISNHIKSKKHEMGKERLHVKEKREQDIAESLVRYNQKHHMCGETLPQNIQVYWVKVVSSFLRAGVPLSKVDSFRPLLEENGYRLTDRRHLFDVIPFILEEEEERLKKELLNKDVSVCFDGMTRLGEALAVVAQIINDDWSIQQRLIQLKVLTKALCGDELAREIINALSTTYGIRSSNLIAVSRDGASVNGAAMRTISVVYPDVVDVTCFSHMLNRVGEHFETPHLAEFTSSWISLFSHSCKAKLLWKTLTGKAMASYSSTRWWSKWEVQLQLLEYFGDVEGFLRTNSDLGLATRAKLLQFFDDLQKVLLQIELAAVIDSGERFVKACYNLEGDGILSLSTYELINTVVMGIQTAHWPNLSAVVKSLSQENAVQQQLMDYGRKCIGKGYTYFDQQLTGNFKAQMEIFKVARLFSPSQMQFIKPDSASLQQQLAVLPFLKSDVPQLVNELPAYLARAEGSDCNISPIEWWKCNSEGLPAWSCVAKKIMLLQPSSGSVERVFSLLNSTFGDQQDTSLLDYIQASLMLQYNKR